jgi:hypothetical protein
MPVAVAVAVFLLLKAEAAEVEDWRMRRTKTTVGDVASSAAGRLPNVLADICKSDKISQSVSVMQHA